MAASTSPSSATSTSKSSKIPSSSKVVPKHTKIRRNERERKRVDQVNQGFLRLQESVPKVKGSKSRLSKVETLREAARYIQKLQEQLGISSHEMPADFPTPEQSPVYPQPMYLMVQTPSPSYTSPYYPPAQIHQELNPYYYGNSCSSSVSPPASSSGEQTSFYAHADNN